MQNLCSFLVSEPYVHNIVLPSYPVTQLYTYIQVEAIWRGGEKRFFSQKADSMFESNKSVLKHHNNVIQMKSLLWNMFSYDYYHSVEKRILVSVSNLPPF